MEVCPVCKNKRHVFKPGVGWVRCQCVDRLRANRIMSKSGFPESLHLIESDSFIPGSDPERKNMAEGIMSIVKNYQKRPIFIYSTSPDRDRVSAIICRYLSILHPEIETISFATLDQLVQAQFNSSSEFNDFSKSDVSVISIGREITNKAHQNYLYSFLYDRILGEKFTVVSSAIPQNRILQVYHNAVDALMSENFDFYIC